MFVGNTWLTRRLRNFVNPIFKSPDERTFWLDISEVHSGRFVVSCSQPSYHSLDDIIAWLQDMNTWTGQALAEAQQERWEREVEELEARSTRAAVEETP